MLNLDNITLVCIDTKNIIEALLSLNYSCKDIIFNRVLFFTNKKDIDVSKFKNLKNKLNLIEVPKILNKNDYSKFCLTVLPDYVNTEYCLIIQHDGFIACKDMWTNEFLKYDYIGAPWPEHFGYINRIGNGGFSLRSKKFLLTCKNIFFNHNFNIDNNNPKDISDNEDYLISITHFDKMQELGIKFAPIELASVFSTEHFTEHTKPQSFGFHDKFTEFSQISYMKKYNTDN
jgi:hypothetical protein